MIALYIVISIIVLICLFYIFAIAPRKAKNMEDFVGKIIAHRGMFNNVDIPENSLAAFKNAVDHGFGIELDIRFTKDKQVVVHHDNKILRSCGIDKEVAECTYEELQQYGLFGTEERIPLFKDVLALVDGKVPFIIELKGNSKDVSLVAPAYEMLSNYKGRYVIESFNPYLMREWRKVAKNDVTGMLVTNYYDKDETDKKTFTTFIMDSFIQNLFVRPDFIAYNHHCDKHFPYRFCKLLFRPYLVAWTIRNQKDYDRCRKEYDTVICENLDKLEL